MIPAADRMRTFQGPEVGDISDDDDDGGIALAVSADCAWILRVDIAADLADFNLLHRRFERSSKRSHKQFPLLDEMQRGAASGARAQSGQPRQQLDQALNFRPGNSCRHVSARYGRAG